MKKFVLFIAVLSLFAVSCQSNTVIETGTDGDEAATAAPTQPTPAPDTNAQGADDGASSTDTSTGDGGDQTADADERESGVQATDPTPAPAADTAGDDATDDADDSAQPTPAPEDDADSEPVGPAPGAAAAIQAVVDANDWCEAAVAVEEGFADFESLNFTDPVSLEQGVNQSLAVVTASQRLVPPAIAADVEQTIVGFTAFANALEEANWSFIDLDLAVLDELDAPMSMASYNIELYNFTECGIGPNPGAPPTILDDGSVEADDGDSLPEFDGTIRDQAVLGLVEAGFTEAEANCILEDLDFTDPEALSDPAALLTVFTDCGISLDRLAQLGG